jgi:hypothetical protein
MAALPSVARATAPDTWAGRAHARAAAASPGLFQPDERALVAAVADLILPRTDTPGALDVRVPAFVEVITADWMTDDERAEFRGGLAAMDLHALETHGRAWPALDAVEAAQEMRWLDSATDPSIPARRGYRRLRGFVVHGYLTSERVQKEVLRTEIVPGRYQGCAPLPPSLPPQDLHHAHHE